MGASLFFFFSPPSPRDRWRGEEAFLSRFVYAVGLKRNDEACRLYALLSFFPSSFLQSLRGMPIDQNRPRR